VKKRAKALLDRYEIDIFVDPDDPQWYCARVPDLPGLFTGGATPEEALQQAQEAIAGYLEICEEDSLPIPEPLPPYTEELTLRLARDLYRTLLRQAEREGRSVPEVIDQVLQLALRASKP